MLQFRRFIERCVFLSVIFRLSSLRPCVIYLETSSVECARISTIITFFTLQMIREGTSTSQQQGKEIAIQELTYYNKEIQTWRFPRSIFEFEGSDDPVNDSVIRYIYQTVNQLCPYSDFCNITGSKLPGRGIKSCCDSCSCDEGCGERMDCCFDFMDNKKIVETNNLSCISALVDEGGLVKDAPHYYMMHKCSRNETYECKSKQLYPWGSLFPIYANSTGFIYYNSECARCNDITGGLHWEIYIDCLTEYITEYAYDFLQPNNWKQCVIRFVPPPTAGVDNFLCYRNPVGKCNATVKRNIYEHFIPEACEIVNAPAFLVKRSRIGVWTKTYKNVFCQLCSGESHSPLDACPLPNWKSKSPIGQHVFTILLDGNVIKSAHEQTGVSYRASNKQTCSAFEAKHPTKVLLFYIFVPFFILLITFATSS